MRGKSNPVGSSCEETARRRWLANTVVRAGALAGGAAITAAVFAQPAAAEGGEGRDGHSFGQQRRTEAGTKVNGTDVGPKQREQSFHGVSGGAYGLRGTIGLSEDGRQLHLGAGVGKPGLTIGGIDKLPDGLNASGKAGIAISKGNKVGVKGTINISPEMNVAGSAGAEISLDLGNGYKLELGGSVGYNKKGEWEFNTSMGRTAPLDKRRELTIDDDGKAKGKLPGKPEPWKTKSKVELDGSVTANGTFNIGKTLESLGILDPDPKREPNSVGGPDERAKARNSSGSPDERDERNKSEAKASSGASGSGKAGPADNPSNGGDRGRTS